MSSGGEESTGKINFEKAQLELCILQRRRLTESLDRAPLHPIILDLRQQIRAFLNQDQPKLFNLKFRMPNSEATICSQWPHLPRRLHEKDVYFFAREC